MKILKRKDAIDRGLNRYFTGKACKHGHIDERYVGDRTCVGCAKKRSKSHKKREGDKVYYQNNKEQIKGNVQNWRENNRDKFNKSCRDRYERNANLKKPRRVEIC